jgi:HK97 gp10 family phage protein
VTGGGDVVRVRGADQVQRSLRRLADDLEHLEPAARTGAELVARAAAGFARVRTGRMRGSIKADTTKFGATVTAGVGIASVYPAVQEFGSAKRRITPNRYMQQAAESQEDRVVKIVANEVSDAVDKVKGA